MTAVEFAQSGDTAEAQRKIVAAGVTPRMIQTLIDDNAADEPERGKPTASPDAYCPE